MGYEGYTVLYDVIYTGDYAVFAFLHINSYASYSRYYAACAMRRELIMHFEIHTLSLSEVCYVSHHQHTHFLSTYTYLDTLKQHLHTQSSPPLPSNYLSEHFKVPVPAPRVSSKTRF